MYLGIGIRGKLTDCFVVPPRNDTFFFDLHLWVFPKMPNQCTVFTSKISTKPLYNDLPLRFPQKKISNTASIIWRLRFFVKGAPQYFWL
jgi:hypothetical protein